MSRLTTRPMPKRQGDSTIALINIVFLMLIFFLIAGTLAPPVDKELDPVTTEDSLPSRPPDALALDAEGAFTWRGQPISVEEIAGAKAELGLEGPLRLIVDKSLPAPLLIERISALRAAGLPDLVLVTERRTEPAR
ncbi:ExbD/TolR family protein [Consotaella salsifontis]|uniref:Biopolymer transport protein ExbD n=1 Tax=Consotaella salsifontis TaxID=1365950 RepID=A0A1T4TEH5_9HYPH|nr:biopolymer transporter ExbD [Consotaella salsifontis]SKA38721.1 biopolymer transport protein ExbD [Consotaella salsifontis]